jgi:hypothetical protein
MWLLILFIIMCLIILFLAMCLLILSTIWVRQSLFIKSDINKIQVNAKLLYEILQGILCIMQGYVTVYRKMYVSSILLMHTVKTFSCMVTDKSYSPRCRVCCCSW